MYIDFFIKKNEEDGRIYFKSNLGRNLTPKKAFILVEAISATFSSEFENEHKINLEESLEELMGTYLVISLENTESGWILDSICEELNARNIFYLKKCLALKKLLVKYLEDIDDEGIYLAKQDALYEYQRKYPQPKVIERPINKSKKSWNFTCSCCLDKVKSTDIDSRWAISIYRKLEGKYYCSEGCAKNGLSLEILEIQKSHFERILKESYN